MKYLGLALAILSKLQESRSADAGPSRVTGQPFLPFGILLGPSEGSRDLDALCYYERRRWLS
jgi:hypothetical protein